jgi:hypothetical protein
VGNKQASKPANFDDYVKQNWDSVLNSNSSRGHEPTAMRNLTESWNIRTGEVVDYEKALQKMMGTQTQVAASSTQLAQATQPVAAAVKQSAESTKQLASASSEAGPAMQPVNEQLLKQVQTSMALKGAQKELNVSYKNLKDAQSIFGQSAAQGNKQAQEAIASYEKEAIAAQMKVNVLKEEASAYKTVGKAAHESVPPMMAGSAALRIFEGNWGTSVRAAERFLVTTLKLGPVLQAAFPIFGAMALIGALDMMFENVKKLIEAFKSLDVEQQRTATNAVLAGERIIKAQKESFISASNFARLLAGVPGGPEDVKVSNFQANLRELSLQQDIQKAKTEANIQGLTGAAQQKA